MTQPRVLHVSPTYYAANSVVGGGEKYVIYMCRAISMAAAAAGDLLESALLSFGECPGLYQLSPDITCQVIHGQPWDPQSVNVRELRDKLESTDVVVVHQCLTAIGLFVASQSRLLNKMVVGVDAGGGEHPIVDNSPEIGKIFDFFLAFSDFVALSFQDLDCRVEVIRGPVDSLYYSPSSTVSKDPELILAVGRILPHKGFDRIIRALPSGLRLVIAGTSFDAEYREYLENLSCRGAVEIQEHLNDDEVLFLMRSARIFVHASTHIDYHGTYYAKPELLGLACLEALSTGTPAFVSSAGALTELSTLPGCFPFNDDRALANMLSTHKEVLQAAPTPEDIHRGVEEKYGLEAFGKRFLDAIAWRKSL